MRTKGAPRKASAPKVHVITLGCAKNIYDSEVLVGNLAHGGILAAHGDKPSKGDTVVVNTCGFIDRAKQESIDTVLQFAKAKQKGTIEKLVVMGCLSERYRAELSGEIEGVDAWFGTHELPEVMASLGVDYKQELMGERMLSTPSHYAYLKISEGCNRPCAFCAIPLMRGKHVSTPIETLVKEAEHLARNGTKELILIAQESTFYGLDIYGERSLPQLLKALNDVDGIQWIRLQYAYPSNFPVEIFSAMKGLSKVCHYLDMPLQHIADPVLKRMRRGITEAKTRALIDLARKEIPDLALRTTLLVGFPGETEDDFNKLVQFVKDVKFERLGVFTYSHEENTHAGDTMIDDVPAEVKEARMEALMEVQREVSLEINTSRIGQTMDVMIDRMEGEYYVGRTQYDSPEVDNEVLIPTTSTLNIGEITQVLITDAMEFDLWGQPVEVLV